MPVNLSQYGTLIIIISVCVKWCMYCSLCVCPQSGEVWYEVAGELAQEGLRPVTPDQEALQEVLHSHEEKAECTLKQQVNRPL